MLLISFRSRWLMLCRSQFLVCNVMVDVTRPAKYPDLPPPSYDESMFGPTNVKEEVRPKPPKLAVIPFVLHSVKGRVIKIYIFAKRKRSKLNVWSRMMVSTQEEIGTFCLSIRDTSQSIDLGIQDYKILYVLFILIDNANIIVCDRLLCQYKCIFCTSGFGAFNL